MVRAPELADWALARGVSALSTAELAELLGVPVGQVRQRLHAPVRRREWVMPVRGLWVPVPPEFRTWGAPPGIDLVDGMMRHLGVDYYVGWLTAASLHGASHQAPQVFQVGVARQVRDRVVGRTRFEFAQRDVGPVSTVSHLTSTGSAPVSSVVATALDVAADVVMAGGIDNAVTTVVELSELAAFDSDDLVREAARFPVSVGRRVGWALDRFSDRRDLDVLRAKVVAGSVVPSRLNPAGPASGEVDERWMVYVNRDVEPDL